MATSERRKYGNLRLDNGGLAGKPRTPEELLDREVAEAFAAVRGKDGQVPSRACYEISEGTQHPERVRARRARELKAAGVGIDAVREILHGPMDRHLDRLYGVQKTGEFRPFAA